MKYTILSKGPFWGIFGGDLYELTQSELVHIGISGYDIETDYIKLDPTGILTVYAGYQWDGASGPTIRNKKSIRASLFHDALYELIVYGYLPLELYWRCDLVLYRILRTDGMWPPTALIWMIAVHLNGKFHIKKDRENKLKKNKIKNN